MAISELEIRINKSAAASVYGIRMQFQAAGSAAKLESNEALVTIDLSKYEALSIGVNTDDYGKQLTKDVFSDRELEAFFEKANATAQMVAGSSLRIRLAIAPDAASLHAIRWELLRDLWSEKPLVAGERVWFSRQVHSQDWIGITLRPKEQLKALIAVANPLVDPKKYPALALIDGNAEINRAQGYLAAVGIEVAVLRGPETLAQLQAKLPDGFDILYLICHGQLSKAEEGWQSALWFEGEKSGNSDRGEAKRVAGADLVDLIRTQAHRPRLIVLASCQSATNEDALLGDGAPLAALGPQLAIVGVPSVLAMQGKVTMTTVATFMPVFFRELTRDGRIDRAVGAARWATNQAKHTDHWMPALFSRLESNLLWNSGFKSADDANGFSAWQALLETIDNGSFLPVLGPGLFKKIFGTAKQTAKNWSRKDQNNCFPLAQCGGSDLAQVNQFFSRRIGPKKPADMLRQHQYECIKNGVIKQLPEEYQGATLTQLDQLLLAVGKSRRETEESEPHRILAELPISLYLTANQDDLLEDALRETGNPAKEPESDVCPWNKQIKTRPDMLEFEPSEQQPLVYHLLGRMNDYRSMVMTEEDYLQYLVGMSRNRDIVPGAVRLAVSERMLVFLGFQVEHWTFRALLRGLMALTDSQPSYRPVAVQIDPDENEFQDVERARQYLAEAFPVGNMTARVYWGSAEDFLAQLAAQRNRKLNGV